MLGHMEHLLAYQEWLAKGAKSLDIAAAKKRCEAATPGKWRVDRFVDLFQIFDEHGSSISNRQDNRDFIAHARSDLPAALEALEEAQGLLKNLPHAYKCYTYDDGGSCDCYLVAINTFLGENE